MNSALIEYVLSNAIVSTLVWFCGTLLLCWRRIPMVLPYALFVLALVKLITPPILALPIEPLVIVRENVWSDGEGAGEFHDDAAIDPRMEGAEQPPHLEDFKASLGEPAQTPATNLPENASSAQRERSLRQNSQTSGSDETKLLELVNESAAAAAEHQFESRTDSERKPLRVWSLFWSGFLLIWPVGSVMLVARHLRQLRSWQRLWAESTRPTREMQDQVDRLSWQVGLRTMPELRWTQARISPLAWGFSRPKILVPKKLYLQLSEEEFQFLLLHELTHLRRHDHWTRLLEIVTGLAYWWLPTYWLSMRSLQNVEERLCDRQVLAMSSHSRDHYLEMLMKTLEFLAMPVRTTAFASHAISSKQVKQRFLHILEADGSRPSKGTTVATLIVASFVLLPFSPTWGQRGFSLASLEGNAASTRSDAAPSGDQDSNQENELVRIAGRVIDEQGNGVSPAIVNVRLIGNVEQRVECNENGEFEAVLKPTVLSPSAIVTARDADGTRLGIDERVILRVDRETDEYPEAEVTLRRPRVALVKTHHEDGSPASNVRVDAIGHGWTFGSAQTNERGVAKLVLPANAPVFYILATSDGKFGLLENLSFSHQRSPNALPREVTLNLMPCDTAQVQFVDKQGSPISGVQVAVQVLELPRLFQQVVWLDNPQLVSDRNGRVRIPWVPHQALRLRIYAIKEGMDWVSGNVTLKGPGGTIESQSVELTRTGILTGKVTDQAGNPVSSVVVQASAYHVASTNGKGEFQMQVPANEATELKILPRSWKGRTNRSFTVATGQRLANVDIEATPVESPRRQVMDELDLPEPERKFGKVVDGEGNGIANCDVVVGARFQGQTNVQSFTNAEGVFEYVDFGVTPRFVFARSPQHNLAGYSADLKPDQPIEVVMQPAVEISGVVYNRETQRIRDGQVQAYIQFPDAWNSIGLGVQLTGEKGEFAFRGVPIGSTFKYELRLPRSTSENPSEAREVSVRALAPIELPPIVSPVQLGTVIEPKTEESAQDSDDVTLVGSLSTVNMRQATPEINADSITLSGRTFDSSTNKSIAGARLSFNVTRSLDGDDPIQVLDVESNVNGRFEITFEKELLAAILEDASTADVHIKMQIHHDGYVPVERSLGFHSFIECYGSKFEVALTPGRRVRGRLIDSDGKPLPNVRILNIHNATTTGAGPSIRGQTNQDGSFEQWVPKDGYADINFLSDDHASARYSVKKGELIPDEVQIVATFGAELVGVLLDLEGRPVANRMVYVRHREAIGDSYFGLGSSRSAKTNHEGKFRVEHLQPGRQVLTVSNDLPDELSSDESMPVFSFAELVLREGETQQIELSAVKSYATKVSARRRDGEPFSGAKWQLLLPLPDGSYWKMSREIQRGEATFQVPSGMSEAMLLVDHQGYSAKYKVTPSGEVGYGNKILFDGLTVPKQVELTYFRAPQFRVSIIDADGNQVDSAQVEATYVDTEVQPSYSLGDKATNRIGMHKQANQSWIAYGLIPEREIVITISSAGFHPLTRRLAMDEGEKRELTFRLGEKSR